MDKLDKYCDMALVVTRHMPGYEKVVSKIIIAQKDSFDDDADSEDLAEELEKTASTHIRQFKEKCVEFNQAKWETYFVDLKELLQII